MKLSEIAQLARDYRFEDLREIGFYHVGFSLSKTIVIDMQGRINIPVDDPEKLRFNESGSEYHAYDWYKWHGAGVTITLHTRKGEKVKSYEKDMPRIR